MANDEAASDGCAVPFGAMPPPTRSTRQSSRTSSPFTTSGRKSPAPAAIDPDLNQKPASMQEWTEPPRAPPQPSFMDHHFDRTSIFQDMQPLGAMPSAKLKQKMRENHARRLMASESAAVNAVDEERASTETTPAVEMARTQSQVTENTKVESVSPPQTE
ncbi:MAG: hypothetical protein INR71_00625, partial [Terriglobus roseus]|nr:hypothetical protein [Terriglobus roseus]